MDNIANYYVLPLLKLNKSSLGGKDNFVNTYISQGTEIIVEVKDKKLVPEHIYDHVHYVGDKGNLIIFKQPAEYEKDVLKFAEGRFSEMSIRAKEAIINFSGLPYNLERKDLPKLPNGSYPRENSRMILALSKDSALRRQIENDLGVKLPLSAELVDKPNMNNFYPLEEQK